MNNVVTIVKEYEIRFEKETSEILEKKVPGIIIEAGNTYLPNILLANIPKCESKVLNQFCDTIRSIEQKPKAIKIKAQTQDLISKLDIIKSELEEKIRELVNIHKDLKIYTEHEVSNLQT